MRWTYALFAALAIGVVVLSIMLMASKLYAPLERMEARMNAYYAPLRWVGDINSPIHIETRMSVTLTQTVTNGSHTKTQTFTFTGSDYTSTQAALDAAIRTWLEANP